jgi:hypothetical protein
MTVPPELSCNRHSSSPTRLTALAADLTARVAEDTKVMLNYFSNRITQPKFVEQSLQLSCAPKLESLGANDGHTFGDIPDWELWDIKGVHFPPRDDGFCV